MTINAKTFCMAEWLVECWLDGCTVIERAAGIKGHLEFGPMDPLDVLVLISTRRDMYEAAARKCGHDIKRYAC